MSGEELSRALSDISDDKIEAAMEIRPAHRKWWPRVVAAAAVLALILTAALWPRGEGPGQQLGSQPTHPTQMPTAPTESKGKELVQLAGALKMYSYNQENLPEEELKQYEIMDSLDSKDPFWIETVFAQYAFRFVFRLPADLYGDAKIKIALSTEYGEFYVKDETSGEKINSGKSAEVGLEEKITWRPECDLEILKESINPGELYLHITMYADDNIVGFGVIEMAGNFILDGSFYAVTLRRFRTFCYPMVDGAYQTVTEEYIAEQIEQCEHTMQEDFEAWLEEKMKEKEQEKEQEEKREEGEPNGLV